MFQFFFNRKMFFISGSKGFVYCFCNNNKNLYNKFEFLEK